MRGFLRSLAAQGRVVLVSSHLMGELQDTADHLVIVGRGAVIADSSMAELIARASSGRVTLRTTARAVAMTVLERAEATVTAAGPGVLTVTGLAAEDVIKILSDNGISFSEVSAHRASLEQAYLELTRDASEYRAVPAAEVTP
jgi:ABC-2 type transport system ATP-binding protein